MELFRNPLILAVVMSVLLTLPIIIAASKASRKRSETYREIPAQDGFNLRYCSARRFFRWLKIFPWEGVGVLQLQGQDLVFEARPNRGNPVTVRSRVENLTYHGRRNWFRNGLLPWMLLKSDGGDFYLCVETGPSISGAGKKTHEMLATIKARSPIENS